MDTRLIFSDHKELLSMVTNIFHEKKKAAFLVYKKGMFRIEGLIASIQQNKNTSETVLIMEDQKQFALNQVIGVNGVFQADYSEC